MKLSIVNTPGNGINVHYIEKFTNCRFHCISYSLLSLSLSLSIYIYIYIYREREREREREINFSSYSRLVSAVCISVLRSREQAGEEVSVIE